MIDSKIGRIDLPQPTVAPEQYRTVRQAFAGLHDGVPNQTDVSRSKPETVARMRLIPPGGNWRNLTPELQPPGDAHSDILRRLEWDRPSITIVNPRKSMLIHPEEDRILSVRECARLFDVPDDFVFHGSLASRQQQIANAVPVALSPGWSGTPSSSSTSVTASRLSSPECKARTRKRSGQPDRSGTPAAGVSRFSRA